MITNPNHMEDSTVQGISPELKERAQELACRMAREGLKTAEIELMKNGSEHIGILSTSEEGMIAIGHFECEGKQYYLGIPMP